MTYSGRKLFNGNNAVFVFMLAFDALIFMARGVYWGTPFLVLFFIFTANEAFYFELNTDELIVKNYLLPFINIRYQLSEITSVELNGTNLKSAADAALKVIRDDKSSMGFKGGALNLSDWQGIVDDLSERKIPVAVNSRRLEDRIGIPKN